MKYFLLPLLFLFASCSYDKSLTPAQQEQVTVIDQQIEADKATARKIEADASLLLDKAQKENDPAAIQELAAVRVQYEQVKHDIEMKQRERDAMLNSAVQENFGGVLSWITGLLPGVPKPLTEGLLALGIPLMFKRPREHAIATVTNLAKGRMDEAMKSVGKMYGLSHTNDSATDLIAAARTVALKEGDLEMVKKLDAIAVS